MKYQAYAEYKDSGIEWFGFVPHLWIQTRLKFESSINMGQSPNSEDCNQDGYGLPFLQGNAEFGIKNPAPKLYCDIPRKIANEGQLLFSVRAPVGALNIADQKYGIGRGLCAIDTYEKLANSFLWWLMVVHKSQLDSVSTGSTFEAVSAEQVENVIFFKPSFSEQTTIANFLDHETAKIDTLIEKQQQLIQLLKEKRQAVISHAVTKGLNPDAPMRDSGVEWLGEVPEHWVVTKFNYEIDFQEGPGILANDFHDEGVPLLRIQNLKGEFLTEDYKTYLSPGKVVSKWGHFRVSLGDLIISSSASMGLVSEVGRATVGAIPYTGLIRLRPKKSSICKDYIRFLVQSDLFFEQINILQTGATIQHYGPAHLQQMYITLPPIDEQIFIANSIKLKITKINDLIDKVECQILFMQERRTALISAAVTGKIDVRNWQPSKGVAA